MRRCRLREVPVRMKDMNPNPDLLMLPPTVSRVLVHALCCTFHIQRKINFKTHKTKKKTKTKQTKNPTKINPKPKPQKPEGFLLVRCYAFPCTSTFLNFTNISPRWKMNSCCLWVSNIFALRKLNKPKPLDSNNKLWVRIKRSQSHSSGKVPQN